MVRYLHVELQLLRNRGKAKNNRDQNFDWMAGNAGKSQQIWLYTNRRLCWCTFRKYILVGVPQLILRSCIDSGEVIQIGMVKSFPGSAITLILTGDNSTLGAGRETLR